MLVLMVSLGVGFVEISRYFCLQELDNYPEIGIVDRV